MVRPEDPKRTADTPRYPLGPGDHLPLAARPHAHSGGGRQEVPQTQLYAYTALDVFTKEPSIFIGTDLEMETGVQAFARHHQYYGPAGLHQSDNGSEFRTDFVAAVESTGATHRYSRPYKKNEQAHIENFNKALRSECLGDAYYSTSELAEVQQKVDEFAGHYIHQRWHMGLPDMMTPAQFQDWHNRDPKRAKVALEKVYG
ncbi:hypothetical protein BRC19_00305 [Candidatus Saccharibacteria bacterium QS_5_54_17]|nr:MAG: hypothetical protein BRC19_00305 [Candidatus Saccharibacteria bacterium QS_5_54_17]